MTTSKKILLIEDDPQLGKLIEAALKETFGAVSWAKTPEMAKKMFKNTHFDILIVDCMLPQMGGVELAEEIRRSYNEDFELILTSGIFKNSQFIKEAVEKTKAHCFLEKPFDILDLIETVRTVMKKQNKNIKFNLNSLFSLQELKGDRISTSLNSLPLINTHFLPFVYHLIYQKELTGDLYIQPSNSQPSILSFYKGQAQRVELQDKESFFGVLLVENGFATPEEISQSLASKEKKRIGEKLVDQNFLSPHAIHIVNTQQMAIRLSKTLNNELVEISFKVRDDYQKPDSAMSYNQLLQLSHDWLFSKYEANWHSLHLLPFSSLKFRLDKLTFDKVEEYIPYYKQLNDFKNQIGQFSSLESLSKVYQDHELEFYSAFLFLIMTNTIRYEKSNAIENSQDFKFKQKRLSMLLLQLEKKNFFEILEIKETATSNEVKASYQLIAQNLHPDKLHSSAPEGLKKLNEKVFSIITEAYNTLSNESSKTAYINKLKNGDINSLFEAEKLLKDAKKKLSQQRYKDAYILLSEALEKQPNNDDIISYYIWSKIKYAKNIDNKVLKQEVDHLMTKISPEAKHNELFFLIKGLYFIRFGDLTQARKFLKYAITINSKFLEARRELLALEANIRSNHSSLIDELSTVFGSIMKKKKKKKKAS